MCATAGSIGAAELAFPDLPQVRDLRDEAARIRIDAIGAEAVDDVTRQRELDASNPIPLSLPLAVVEVGTVELDHEAEIAPEEVNPVPCDEHVHLRSRKSGLLPEPEEAVLGVGLGTRRGQRMGHMEAPKSPNAPAPAGALQRRRHEVAIDAAKAVRFLVEPHQMSLGAPSREVDQGAGHRRAPDPVPEGEVLGNQGTGVMDDDSLSPPGSAPASGRDDVHRPIGAELREAVEVRGAEVAHRRALADGEPSGDEAGSRGDVPEADGVHAAMQRMEEAGLDSPSDSAVAQPDASQLPGRDDAVLARCELGDRGGRWQT